MLNFENLNKCIFQGVGPYDIPEIDPETDIPIHKLEWIPFNYAKSCKNPQGKGIHFYVDDYQFVRLWNEPNKYIPLLQRFDAVCTPDFSQYTDIPESTGIPRRTREICRSGEISKEIGHHAGQSNHKSKDAA